MPFMQPPFYWRETITAQGSNTVAIFSIPLTTSHNDLQSSLSQSYTSLSLLKTVVLNWTNSAQDYIVNLWGGRNS